jgi:ubiquinone/menaquinone biosynthesis C-methylase UbiE
MSGSGRRSVSWRIFEAGAAGYEAWYVTGRGRRADAAERRLLLHLLEPFRDVHSAVEIGCGTGHFAAFLVQQGIATVGLDRAPAMLSEARRLFPLLPVVLGDAHRLPFRRGCVDLAVFVTTLEFMEDPILALREAVCVARRGVVAIALNRRSLGGLSRRWGPQSRGALLGQAHDYSLAELQLELRHAAGPRLQRAWSASTLFPDRLSEVVSHIALGDVIGSAVGLTRPKD